MDIAATGNAENLRILLVDDDTFIRRTLERALEQIGFEHILQATNGMEALDILERDNIDILITDIQMPELNGLELLQTIRGGRRSIPRALRTIIITSLTDIETLGIAIGLDVNGFLTKPFKPIAVVKAIDKALSEDHVEILDAESYLKVSVSLDEHSSAASEDDTEAHTAELSIYDLEANMCLAKDVLSESGMLLLAKGFTLNERSINRLKELSTVVEGKTYSVYVN